MSSERSPQPRESQTPREPVGLADTSVFIARESGRPIGSLPRRVSVSVVTVGELQLGVLAATDRETRARRAGTLALARRSDPIAISEAVMAGWAQLTHACVAAGIARKVRLMDALIAATALEHGLAVVTQDDDFDLIAEAHPPLDVIKV
ncbi:MAG: PIN domain-containing protein [Solirubrobacterales bacterium]|nr:PIN domain-containing protein [Solirubrobacterales bacterium]